MRSQHPDAPDAVERQLEREINEVRGAIEMVATGRATAISITGLRFGESLLEQLGPIAAERRVVLEPRWWPADSGCDLVVRRDVPEA